MKYKVIMDKDRGDDSCRGCIANGLDTCREFIIERRSEGLPACEEEGCIYVENTNTTEDLNTMPELKAGMVVEYESSGLWILLPDSEGVLGMYDKKGINYKEEFILEKITNIYFKRDDVNYAGFFASGNVYGESLKSTWNHLWARLTEDQVKAQKELEEVEEEIKALNNRKQKLLSIIES